jgi:hypothetical protein
VDDVVSGVLQPPAGEILLLTTTAQAPVVLTLKTCC